MGDRGPCSGSRRPSQAAVGTHAKIGNVLLCIRDSPSRAFDPIFDIDQAQEALCVGLPLESPKRLHIDAGMLGDDRDVNVVDAPSNPLEDRVGNVDKHNVVLTCAWVMMPNRADVESKLDLFRNGIREPSDGLGHLLERPMEHVMKRLIEILRPSEVFLVLRLHGDIELDCEVLARDGPHDFLDFAAQGLPRQRKKNVSREFYKECGSTGTWQGDLVVRAGWHHALLSQLLERRI